MAWYRTISVAACVAFLFAGCADREPPAETAARADAPRPTSAATVASDSARPAPSAAPAASPAPAAQPAPAAREGSRAVPPPLLAPTNISATPLSPSQVVVSWQVAPGSAPPAGYEVFRDDRLVGSAHELRLTDDHLRPWSRHCYAVRAYDAAGVRSARSSAACAQTLDDTPPTAPGDLHAEGQPGDAIQLTWSPSTDDVAVAKYEVWRSDKVIATVDSTRFREAHLTPTKEYCYAVRALDPATNRSAPAGPTCAVVPDSTPPTTPSAVSAAADGEHAIVLGWKPSTDDVGVARYEMTADDEAPRTASSSAQTSARHDGLAVATRHCYGVRACDAANNCSAWSPPVCATTPDLTPPSQPRSPSAVAPTDTETEVRWGASTDNVGVTGYEVLRGDEIVARTESATTAREVGLHPARQYCYTVRAHDLAGNTSILSAKACATTPDLKPPTTPQHPAAVPVSSTQVFVAWDPSTDDVGVAGYEVYRDAALVAKVTATRGREYGLQPAHKYCYTVRAFDAAGNRSTAAGPFCTMTTTPAELSAPSDLRVRRVSPTNILLQWEPSESKGVLYRVYANGDRAVGLTDGNTFMPSGRMGAEPNCFRVSAVDASDRESPKSNEVCATSGALSAR